MSKLVSKVTTRYLDDLSQALRSAPLDVRQEALRDAQEFLHDELSSLNVWQFKSDRQLFDHFVDRFGSPEHVAATYLEQTSSSASQFSDSTLRSPNPWKSILVGSLLIFAIAGTTCFAMLREPPKLSPFTKVVFQDNQVMVEYQGECYAWKAIEDILVSDIIRSAKKQFGDHWQKRVAEDMVEVLWGMDLSPGDTVKLLLYDTDAKKELVVENAIMSESNRQAVWRDRYEAEDEVASNKLAEQLAKVQGQPPKLSPFTSVGFHEDQVFVEYEGTIYEWLSLDDISIAKILDSARERFSNRWQKRVAEDLVEVLWGMEHSPEIRVKLELRNVDTNAVSVIEDAPMTTENRRAVWSERNH